ncbi:MAG: riboflavin kinase / adenylyltransferase [Actinomycetota bacterium]|jgi:riboflavin kinase/FMN adenylyltransferase|nr:riboflavin kinase / adenylyltransferase [Actinomycetota bacterium]MDQ1500445.1 riboflavin kinase / adenylyltransferase [Actinomycetota bacterium]
MEVVTRLDACPDPPTGTVVTIGAFDGVHLGHQALLRMVRERAAERGLPTALVTFDRHPAQVVRPESAPKLLTSLPQRLELLEATGLVDHAVVLTFDDERRRESAEDFVTQILEGCLHARLVVVGADFHFGNGRRGNVALLERMGRDLGFDVVGLDLVRAAEDADRVTYSSTLVRQRLADGDVRGAAEILGRVHEVRGTVVEGDRRGRELGFPTANVAVPEEICLPAAGIYAGTFTGTDGVARPAAISLGHRPTFYSDQAYLLLEAYLLDFNGDLYGQAASVGFVERIRAEERFDSAEALVAAMHRDVEAARRLLDPRA